MSAADFTALSPVIVIAVAAIAVMMLIAFSRSHILTVLLTVTGLAGSFFSLFPAAGLVPMAVTPLIVIDGYSLFYMGLILMSGFVVTVLSYSYLESREENPEEFYLLLLLAVLGSMVLVSARHFASFFLGLEVLTVSLYALVAYVREAARSNEAGLKYLVLAGVSSAFLLFGMALVYAGLGTMEFGRIAEKVSIAADNTLVISGFALTVVGIGFKLALVPFHMWTPDVYEGAPAPVAAFIATASKGAVFALLLRFLGGADLQAYRPLFLIFSLLSITSMLAGNLLALFQQNVKRILAYSSIAHLGYLVVAFLAEGRLAATAVSYYLAAYFVTMLGAFGVVTLLSGKKDDAESLDDYRGLAVQRPWLAGIFTVMLLSLAGIPLTAGFMGKFYVVAAGANSALWLLVVILAASSAIGLFYYLRIVAVLFMPGAEEKDAHGPISFSGGFMTVCLAAVLFWLGVYPSFLINLIRTAMSAVH
ncbi:MAG: NADH-quinone oxidoreductase subunit N [Nitrospiraceae bacterium]|nr:NADH-quinone oxidoreductase subunit N [Nitrospiraceae bacterium]